MSSAAMTQLEVVQALIVRETRTSYGTTTAGYLWALAEPAIWISLFYAVFAATGRGEGISGMDILGFLVTGFCTFLMFKKVWKQSTNARKAKGLLALPRVTALDVAIARALLAAATMVTVFLLFMLLNWLVLGQAWYVDSVLSVLAGMGLASGMGFGFGLALDALAQYTQLLRRMEVLIQRPLFWTSGLFFAADLIPSSLRDIVIYNPLLHAVELVRGGWFVGYRATYASPSYAAAWMIGLILLGLTAERASRRRALA